MIENDLGSRQSHDVSSTGFVKMRIHPRAHQRLNFQAMAPDLSNQVGY
jgi:hypothetical protein